ncbi:MAG TPA: HemK/PrmC family methyltransferase [Acidimicrobiia bacterium]|nr:HemK/PrmC family methyltransferase [Acidimicrobiia bacterium]
MTGSRDLITASKLPSHEAARLLALVTGHAVGELRAGLTIDDATGFAELVARRLAGVPLQYLEGEVTFGPITVSVDERVLIPRPETEYLYSLVANQRETPGVIVDLGSGSGALALALKHRFPQARVLAVDISSDALEVSRANGKRLGLEVEWREGDLWQALPAAVRGRVDLLVANPPYVSEQEWQLLPADVKEEPMLALVGGPKGTEIIEEILVPIEEWLAPYGVGYVEVGETQAQGLAGRYNCVAIPDQYGKPRFLQVVRR